MSDIVSPVQNISYTNKDFVRVYEELLDLARELSSKWDPSLSNESDPGVILLKLNAVLADKCNYNIDKSVLECFPLSVTQMPNARQLFDQLGYRMHWRKSANSTVSINWVGVDKYPNEYITLDPFTMITDAENNIVYTLLGIYDNISYYNVSQMKLLCDGASSSAIKCNVIQGVPVDFTISGNKLITIENLDENNRLYFPDTSIAENGVFINNAGESENYNKWQRKDNLSIENFGNYYYKFDVNKEGTNCYIEFPEDVESLFGEGIYIKYIRTDSEYGNINANILTKFYDTITAKLGGENVILNTDVISITNSSSINNGTSFETINDAYRNYKHTVGTFKTLVTLRDYINAILNSGFVSNCFVCDRTNDIQTTYKVLTTVNDVDQSVTYIEEKEELITTENNDEILYKTKMMDAFSLKLYLLNYVAVTTEQSSYKDSFNMLTENDTDVLNVKNYIDSEKCINHDYESILNPGEINPHVAYFRNIYPIECTIIAQTELNNQQKQEIRKNINDALRDNLSSKQVEFGEAIAYDLIYNIISNADPRIKSVSLFNINYNTEAVYYDDNSFLTYVVNSDTGVGNWYDDEFNKVNPINYGLTVSNPIDGATIKLPATFKSEFINGENYDDIYFCSNSNNIKYVPVNKRDSDNISTVEVDPVVFYNKVGLEDCYKKHLFTCTSVVHNYGWYVNEQKINLSDFGISLSGDPAEGDVIAVSFNKSIADPEIDDLNTNISGATINFTPDTFTSYVSDLFPASGESVIFEYRDENTFTATWYLDDHEVDLNQYGISLKEGTILHVGDQFKVKLSYGHQVKYDTIAKCILVGSTQFYVKDETFDYRLNQIAHWHKYDYNNDGEDEELLYIPNIAKICGDVSISFTPTQSVYKLRDNESLQLYAPNLIDLTSYSNYVKFEYYITENIVAKSNYQLRNNEFIIFYWTESDDEAGVIYKYHCYGNGTVICPSFSMSLKTINDKNDTIAVKNGLVLYDNQGNVIESSWSKNSLMSLTASEQIANITTSSNILSGSKKIQIKSINEFTINRLSQYYLYWVLNDTSVDSFKQNKYTLFYEGETSRMLGTGEYIIYTDAYKKNYEILGEGTLLTRNTISNDWTVNAIDSSDVLLNGISAIEGNWFTLEDNDELTVTENSFTNIGSGCSLSITAKDPKTNFYTLNYTSSVNDLVTEFNDTIWYSSFISAGTYVLTYDEENEYWNISLNGTEGNPISNLENVGITIDDSITLTDGDSITVNVLFSYKLTFTRNGYTLNIPENSTEQAGLSLSDFDIKYLLAGQDDNSTNWVTIDSVTLNSTIGWNGRSILSLNFGPSNQQYLLSNQYIHIINSTTGEELPDIVGGNKTYYIDISGSFTEGSGNSCEINSDVWNLQNPLAGEYVYTYETDHWEHNSNIVDLDSLGITITGTPDASHNEIVITNVAPAHYPMVILGSHNISCYGTEFIPTFNIDYNDAGEIVIDYLDIYSFTELQNITGQVMYLSTGNVVLTFSPDESSKEIKFLIPDGDYILPIKNNVPDLTELSLSLDNEPLELMFSDENKPGVDYSNINNIGMYYIYMKIENESMAEDPIHILTVNMEGHTMESSIQIGNCYKYVRPKQYGNSMKTMSVDEFNEIHHLITYLDNKHIFKYDNIVNINEQINDPVSAASFNLSNHIYNPFTICEFSTATIN